jgi:hypothetical protein
VVQNVLLLYERCLTANLSTNLIVRETGSGEEGNFLASGNRVHHIDGRNTSLDHFLRVNSFEGVDWLALY